MRKKFVRIRGRNRARTRRRRKENEKRTFWEQVKETKKSI